MPQRRHFLLSGLAMVLLSTSALGGHALAQKGESMDPVSGWSSTSVPNKGNSSYCAVARRFNGNVILTLARNMRDETSIALDFDTASFEKGNVFRISLDPGAGEQRSMTVKPTSEKAFVLKLGKDESFYRALLKTGFLRTEIGEKGYNFNLSDIDTGKENLTTCLSQIGAPEVAAASAPTAAPASAPAVVASVPPPATPDPKLAELSQRLAALESENRRLQRTPAAVDPLKSPMTPELPLERVALKPLNDVIEVAPVPAPVAKAPAPVMAAAKPAPAPVFKAPEVASSGNVAKVDQSLIVSMAEENRRLKAQLEDASHAAAPAGIPEEEVAHLNQRLKKLESENKALTRQLDSMETDLALANSSPEISDKDAKTIADLRAENNRLIASLATIQTAAGDDEPDAFAPSASSASAREAERKLSILENQNRVLTRRLDTLLGQNGDYSRQLARYEMQVEELEKQLADSKVSPGPDYAAMVDDLKQEIAAMQAENESLRAENAKPDYALQQQLAELQVENEVLNKEIKKAESEIFVLKEEKSRPDPAMEGEIAALKAENDMLSKEISQARSEIFVLKEQKSKPDPALEGQISALKTENQLLNRQIMDVQAENIALKAQPEGPDYSEMVEQLKAEIAAVQSENMELKEIRATTDPELEGEIAALKTENDLLNLEISRQAELARAEYEDKLESMKVENEVLQERLAGYLSSQDSIMALKNEMEGIKAEKDELSLTMADIQAQAAKLAELETVAHEREEQIALLQGTLDSLEQENVELRRMSIDERAEDSEMALNLASYEEKVEALTLENEGMRAELESLQAAQSDIDALKDANAELASLLEAADNLTAEQQSALEAQQQKVAELSQKMEEGSSAEVLALQDQIEMLGEENKALKDELGTAQIALMSLKQNAGEEISAALEQALNDVPGQDATEAESVLQDVSEAPVSEDSEMASVLDITEADKTESSSGVQYMAGGELDIGEPLRRVDDIAEEMSADEEEAVELASVEAVPAEVPVLPSIKAPIPHFKPAHKGTVVASAKPVEAPVPQESVQEETVDPEALASIETAAGDENITPEHLLEIHEQEMREAGLTEAQRQEMALAREVGVDEPSAVVDMAAAGGHENGSVAPGALEPIESEDLAAPSDDMVTGDNVLARISDNDEGTPTTEIVPDITVSKGVGVDTPIPAESPKASAVTESASYQPAMPIENILSAARIPVEGSVKMLADMSGPNFSAYQWRSQGGLFGSAQQKPIKSEGQFDDMVQAYLTQTEERCAGDFAISPSSTQDSGGTRIDTYEIACVGGGVDSSASLLFVSQGGTFTVVAHESPTEGMESAMDYRDRLVESLKRS